MAGAPSPTWPRSPVSVWLRRGAPGKVLWGGGWASPPGAVSSRKLLSFSFLLGFFSFKGAEVPRGLHQEEHGGFLLCSSLSSSLLSHRPLRPALLGSFVPPSPPPSWVASSGFALFGLWSLLGGVASPSCSCAGHRGGRQRIPPCSGVRAVRPTQGHACGLASVSRVCISEVRRTVRLRPWSS